MPHSHPRHLLLLFLLSAGGLARAAMPPVIEVHKALREIESAMLRGKVDTLRLRYQEQAKNRPGDVTLRLYLAWCGMPSDDSWNAFKAIAAIHPEEPWVHQGMGRIYLSWKMRDQAQSELNLALKSNPRFYPALVGLGEVARAGSDHEQAQARFRAALAIHEDPEARAGLGMSLLAQGKVAEAKVELSRAIELWPDQPPVLTALAKLLREEGDQKNAASQLARLLELTPKDREARRALADLRFELGEKEAAVQEYESYLKLGAVDAEVLKRLAGLYREGEKAEAEERVLLQLAGLEKDSPDHSLRLSELAEARGGFDEAEQHLLEAAARAPRRADIQLKLAHTRVGHGQLREAVEAFRAAQDAGGPEAAEAEKEIKSILSQFKLPKPAKGGVDKIYAAVSRSLNALYVERLKEKPGLGGALKLRVKVTKEGKVGLVEQLEDTVGDPLIAGHVYFALKDAEYPKQKREPVFEFELSPPKKGGR